MDAQIANATQGLTTAAQMRATTQMLMQPHANWETYLTPAPLSIAILMELVFISSMTDFSISKNSPPDGYKYIRYPESFRASLMQVCNSGWHAFNTAHKNMDQVRIYTATVPDYMKNAVKILLQGDDEVVKALLPIQLESIGDIADECVILAKGAEDKFSEVINLIQELLEACINAEHFYGEELKEVKRKVEENKLKEQSSRELNEMSRKVMEAASKQLGKAQDAFTAAMDSLPSGWQMIGMDFVEGLAQIPTLIVSMFTSNTASSADNIQNTRTPDSHEHRPTSEDMVSDMTACSKSGQILKLASSLTKFIRDDGISWEELYDQKTKSVKTSWVKDQFKRITLELEEHPNTKLKDSALSLCKDGIAICNQLETYSPDQEWDEKTTDEMIKKAKKLSGDALKFDTQSKKRSGSPSLTPKPPMMYKSESSGRLSASGRAAENARFRIVQSQEQLRQTRERYAAALQNMENNQRELNDILIELQNSNIKEIDFKTTIKLLGKGMDAMGRVKAQWEIMVLFFQMMATIVKTSLGPSMHNFVAGASQTMALSYNSRLFAKDMIYNQAFQASNIASLVHMISGTYCDVSSKYLMGSVSKLGTLMVMDKENPEFLVERERLHGSCKESQEGISQLVQTKRREFEAKLDARMGQIDRGLKSVLPDASPQETEKIKEIVETAFAEDEAEDYL